MMYETARDALHREILGNVPVLKKYALTLTRTDDQAEDLLHDSLERALTKIHLFRPGTNFRGWLLTVMRNVFINQKRHQQLSHRYLASARQQGSWHAPASQDDRVFLTETCAVINDLSPEEQEAFRLLVVEERDHQEVAALLDVKVGTMKSRLSRGRARIRRRLET